MKSGKYTARSIAEKYLARIDQIDKQGPAINAVIELNPDALAIADGLDKERKEKGVRGPLHGIPVLIKDNIDTADKMMTTAGSLALLGSKPSKDSTVAQKLREAGAVILGKTNLSEWANIRSDHSTSGWSGRGGQTKNPYALDRNPCGSSSGSGAAVSANLCAAAIGTETDGSIVCPSSSNGLVGIKPTVGLVSRTGIIPISHSQDGAGPMCRTVRDAAIVLGALTGIDDAGRRDRRQPRAFLHRLHTIPERGRLARRAHRRGAENVRLQRESRQDYGRRPRHHEEAGRHPRRSCAHRDRWQIRRFGIYRAPVRAESRSERLSGAPRSECARENTAGHHRLQRAQSRKGNALLRAGHVL